MAILGGGIMRENIPDPKNDKERLDLIFRAYEKEGSNMRISVPAIIDLNLGWKLDDEERQRLETLIIGSGLVISYPDGYYKNLQLTNTGRVILLEHKLYSKYVESLSEAQNLDYELEEIKNLNIKLQNQNLQASIKNQQLDKDLKDAQYQLITLQTKELRNKRKWGVIGALLSAALTITIEHFKEIYHWVFK
jgi:hypothetical protein